MLTERTGSLLWFVLLWGVLRLAPLWAADVQTNIGSYEPVQTLADSDTPIDCDNASRFRAVPVQSSTGAGIVTLTTATQILPGTSPGQWCAICGANTADMIQMIDGNGVQLSTTGGTVLFRAAAGTQPKTCVTFSWTGTLWEQMSPQRGIGDDFRIASFPDQDLTLETSGEGRVMINEGGAPSPVAKLSDVTLQGAFDGGPLGAKGRIVGCDVLEPCELRGDTLKRLEYEQGGFWFDELRKISDDTLVARAVDVPPGLTYDFFGDGVPILTFDGTTATSTWHKAPLFDDGIKVTFNPNGTNAGLNIGSQAGAPSTVVNGDTWYDSTAGKFKCREAGTTKDCIGTGAGGGDVVGDDTSTTAQNIVAYSGTGGKNITELTGNQGEILYRGATSWLKLAPGTSGQGLKTLGAGANPIWEDRAVTKSATLIGVTAGDTNKVQWWYPGAVTITVVSCSTDAGTVTINLDERAQTTANTAGTNTLSTGLVCDTNSQNSCSSGCDVNTISDSTIAAFFLHNLQIITVSGATVLRVHVHATRN